MTNLKSDVPRVCPGFWCPCYGCSERRADAGRPPLVLRVGDRRIKALPLENDDDTDGLDGARGVGAALTIMFGFGLGVVAALWVLLL